MTGRVVDNEAMSRFELDVDGGIAELVYRRSPGRVVLVHTEVPDASRRRGIGGTLVAAAVDDAERRGLVVVPDCSFARDWLERHPGVAARVAVEG